MRSKVEILMSILYVIAQVAGSFAGAFIGYGKFPLCKQLLYIFLISSVEEHT